MSAENWCICPKCRKNKENKKIQLQSEVQNKYGKILAADWLELKAQSEQDIELGDIFREDYEIGIDKDGLFYVNYTGRCTICSFRFIYRHTEQTNVE